jgi:hypothetical protein
MNSWTLDILIAWRYCNYMAYRLTIICYCSDKRDDSTHNELRVLRTIHKVSPIWLRLQATAAQQASQSSPSERDLDHTVYIEKKTEVARTLEVVSDVAALTVSEPLRGNVNLSSTFLPSSYPSQSSTNRGDRWLSTMVGTVVPLP